MKCDFEGDVDGFLWKLGVLNDIFGDDFMAGILLCVFFEKKHIF
jgi:hypothetical protein